MRHVRYALCNYSQIIAVAERPAFVRHQDILNHDDLSRRLLPRRKYYKIEASWYIFKTCKIYIARQGSGKYFGKFVL